MFRAFDLIQAQKPNALITCPLLCIVEVCVCVCVCVCMVRGWGAIFINVPHQLYIQTSFDQTSNICRTCMQFKLMLYVYLYLLFMCKHTFLSWKKKIGKIIHGNVYQQASVVIRQAGVVQLYPQNEQYSQMSTVKCLQSNGFFCIWEGFLKN